MFLRQSTFYPNLKLFVQTDHYLTGLARRLVEEMISHDPRRRPTAAQVCVHPLFGPEVTLSETQGCQVTIYTHFVLCK